MIRCNDIWQYNGLTLPFFKSSIDFIKNGLFACASLDELFQLICAKWLVVELVEITKNDSPCIRMHLSNGVSAFNNMFGHMMTIFSWKMIYHSYIYLYINLY